VITPTEEETTMKKSTKINKESKKSAKADPKKSSKELIAALVQKDLEVVNAAQAICGRCYCY
jgi:hypothetical protein